MTKRKENFDENMDLRVSSRLSTDLNALFEPQVGVPAEADRAVMDKAHKHFAAMQSGKRRRLRIHWGWRIAAAAAVIVLAFSLDLTKQPEPTTDNLSLVRAVREPPLQAVDIDRNGRVDILDAFKLARHIELAGRTEKEWDINNDGLVDQKDVDVVALAAVHLDKGV